MVSRGGFNARSDSIDRDSAFLCSVRPRVHLFRVVLESTVRSIPADVSADHRASLRGSKSEILLYANTYIRMYECRFGERRAISRSLSLSPRVWVRQGRPRDRPSLTRHSLDCLTLLTLRQSRRIPRRCSQSTDSRELRARARAPLILRRSQSP